MSGRAELPPSCARTQETAAEAGLGVLVGLERAKVLAHLEGCASCTRAVEEMAEVSDALLTLVPDAVPPPGFAHRVLARHRAADAAHPRKPRVRLVSLAAGAAVIAVIAVIALGVYALGPASSQVPHPDAAATPSGRLLQVASLQTGGRTVGQVFVYDGRPSWVFMTVDAPVSATPVVCEVKTDGGATLDLGTFSTSTGYSAWGSLVSVTPSSIRAVQLVDSEGVTVASAGL